MLKLSETFLSGSSSNYVEQMHDAWKKDPKSVHVSWSSYFENVERGGAPGTAFQMPPPSGSGVKLDMSQANVSKTASESMRLLLLVRAYQVIGHSQATLDPLGLTKNPVYPELQLETYGFSEADLDREFEIGVGTLSGFLSHDRPKATLRTIIQRLKETYCGTIGYQYMHIPERAKCNWIRDRVETPTQYKFSKDEKMVILDRLSWATNWERYLAVKFGNAKRFGLDGAESLIPGLKALIDRATELGVDNVFMGMPHRGRLNVLASVVRKPLEAIFHEFAGGSVLENDLYTGSGDVKYHLGTSYDRKYPDGRSVNVTLLANPSHLEAVNPVVEGKARARQYHLKDEKRERVMSILLHGDSAFAAQGVVYETFDLSGLPNYTTGGTIHVVVNNQIGFTTDPKSSRASIYCTDLGKAASAPIFHVNGDDPEAVVHVFKMAADWRQTYHQDVIIDIICYRRYGHNEGDEPRFTQPVMYQKIDTQTPILESYSAKLVKEGVVTSNEVKELNDKVMNVISTAHKHSENYSPKKNDWVESPWKDFNKHVSPKKKTGVPLSQLKRMGSELTTIPNDIKLHPRLAKIIKERQTMVDTGEKLDWGTAESLAFGSLLEEGIHVRLSGQDVERGTFSHRHAVLHDQITGKTYTPLQHLSKKKENFVVTNSSLSEFGVLGFELGYSLERPDYLVLWEAQFGDFANGAQVILDQFVVSGEAKWNRQSGLVMLLPHGYDGQGPEHSSGRPERFLQSVDSDPEAIPNKLKHRQHVDGNELDVQTTNIQVVNCSTPANYFHALRRQVHRNFRKPLVVMSPKNLLRHPLAVSDLNELSDEHGKARFKRVIAEHNHNIDAKKVSRVIFCTGKVYYELLTEREKRNITDIAIVRLEQIAPFPYDKVADEAAKYPKAEIVWVQEEPKNMGYWGFVSEHLAYTFLERNGRVVLPKYIGRGVSASPATGSGKDHTAQLQKFLNDAMSPTRDN